MAAEITCECDMVEFLCSVAHTLVELGEVNRAGEFWEQALSVTENTLLSYRLKDITHIAQTMAQAGEFERALVVAQSITNETDRCQILSIIAQGMAQAGEYESALVVAQNITCAGDLSQILSIIAKFMAQGKKIEHANNLWDRAIGVTEQILDEEQLTFALCSVALSMIQASRFDQALAVAESITDKYLRSLIQSGIALGLAQKGEFYQALVVFRTIAELNMRIEVFASLTQLMLAGGSRNLLQHWISEEIRQMQMLDLDNIWEHIRVYTYGLNELGALGETWDRIKEVESLGDVRSASSDAGNIA